MSTTARIATILAATTIAAGLAADRRDRRADAQKKVRPRTKRIPDDLVDDAILRTMTTIAPDGLTAVTVIPEIPGHAPQFTTTMSWADPLTALQNYNTSRDGAIELYIKKVVDGDGDPQPTRERIVPFGPGKRLRAFIFTGPPTWWVPRVSFRRFRARPHIMVGWLRGGIAIGPNPRRRNSA